MQELVEAIRVNVNPGDRIIIRGLTFFNADGKEATRIRLTEFFGVPVEFVPAGVAVLVFGKDEQCRT